MYKINKVEYRIEEVDFIAEEQWGVTRYNKQLIQIKKDLCFEHKKTTLIHELTHAFLFEHALPQNENTVYDYERVCELFGAYAEDIMNIVNDYFNQDILQEF